MEYRIKNIIIMLVCVICRLNIIILLVCVVSRLNIWPWQDIAADQYQCHEYVDLGLPSGLKWATCNVGAECPEGYGDYFAWGETSPKSRYDLDNYFDCMDSSSDSFGIYKIGGKTEISPGSGHDTARENWGGSWRMPPVAEYEELVKNCKWVWTTKNSHNGYLVTGPNGNSIFLPAAGEREGMDSLRVGECGYYWFSSLRSLSSSKASSMHINAEGLSMNGDSRDEGQCIRPVIE